MSRVIRFFKDIKFRQKLLVSYIIVVIIPIMVLGLYSYNKSRSYLKQQLESGLNETVRQISLNISNKFEKDNEFIRFVAFEPYLRKVLVNKKMDLLVQTKTMNEYFEPIVWYHMSTNRDFKKLVVYSELLDSPMGSFVLPSGKIKDEKWYQETRKSNDTKWYCNGKEVFAARRIYDAIEDKFLGVLYMSLNFDIIMKKIVKEGHTNFGLIITDSDNQIVYSSSTINKTMTKEYTDSIIMGQEGNLTIEGEKIVLIKDTFPQQNWKLAYFVPLKGNSVNTGEILKATGTIMLACIIVLILIIWLFSKTMVKRIYSLNNKMKIVENGDLNIEVSSGSKDEIGELTNRFGKMVKNLNALIQEVYKSKLVQKEAELKALQAQINPHFLYNAISVINWKALDSENTEISDFAVLLSKFYRTALNKGKNTISIRDELENIKAYIEIQLIMHNYEFDVEYCIEEAIYDFYTVNFIIQPIVENAILHGLDENVGVRGILKIAAVIINNDIEFKIEDNGVGMDKEKAESLLLKDSNGYGIKNVNERLNLFYGEQYGIRVESGIEKGTVVHILIPKCKN